MLKGSLKKEQFLLLVLFLIFMSFRLFSETPYLFVAGDQGKYLGLAKNFPGNELYNKEILLDQRPLYSYGIHFLSFLFEDHIAGIIISLISAAVTFFIIYKLVMLVMDDVYIALGVLILFSLSTIFIWLATNVLKESFSTMLILATVYNYIKFLKYNNIHNMIYSAIFGVLSGLASDHAIFLIPSMIVIYFFFMGDTKLLIAAIPLILVILVYSSWMGVRMYTYMSHDFYPAGWDGTVVNTEKWGSRQL